MTFHWGSGALFKCTQERPWRSTFLILALNKNLSAVLVSNFVARDAAKADFIWVVSVPNQWKAITSKKKIQKSLISYLLTGLLIKRGDLLFKRSSTDRTNRIHVASDSPSHNG
jgi:hypothetical protein